MDERYKEADNITLGSWLDCSLRRASCCLNNFMLCVRAGKGGVLAAPGSRQALG